MGVKIVELLKMHETSLGELSNKTIVIDAPNHLYQFLTTIRAPDGSPFTDRQGNITSHLIGLFSRTTSLMQNRIRLAYVFDGKVPELKHKELERRKEIKKEAEALYSKALSEKDEDGMRKYAGRSSRLTGEMIAEAKKLLDTLGVPYIDAPSEAEAQAAFVVKNKDANAVSSQDADSLLFGAPRIIRNLSITGRRKKPGKQGYTEVSPEMILLEENLNLLGISQEQLIVLGMLIGTDYNPGGINGIGPKKALALVKKHGNNFDALFAEAKWSSAFNEGWEEIFGIFEKIPVTKNYDLKWKQPEKGKVIDFLCKTHGFSEERVAKTMDTLANSQKGLSDFF